MALAPYDILRLGMVSVLPCPRRELRCAGCSRLLCALPHCHCSPAPSCSGYLSAHTASGYTASVLLAMFPRAAGRLSLSLNITLSSVLSLCRPPSTLCWVSTFCCSSCQAPKSFILQACLSSHAQTRPAAPSLSSHTGAQNPISWEVQRFDGWYNNLMEHRWGSKGR